MPGATRPGRVAGVIQINTRVPRTGTAGDAVPVVLTIGGVSRPAGVTMTVW